jgi:electron transport complex protein RnfC
VLFRSGGETSEALVIHLEGSFELLGKRENFYSWKNLSPAELRELIAEYGIVEMEGEGKPLGALIGKGESTGVEQGPATLVIRCVFDDPWLAADRVLCRERTGAVVEGSFIAARAGGFGRLVFAVSRGERRLGAELLEEAKKGDLPASLVLTSSKYPQRNRRELELVLRNYGKQEEVEMGSLTILGPATLAAVRDAVVLHKPILERYVAIGGSAVKSPQVIRARLGIRLGELFAECGGFAGEPRSIATGSPFLGRPVVDLDEPLTKTDYAVFALLGNAGRGAVRICCGCGECRAVCPVGLDPEELYKQGEWKTVSPAVKEASLPREDAAEEDPLRPVCHGCGCCELVCPSRLPLSSALKGLPGGTRHAG